MTNKHNNYVNDISPALTDHNLIYNMNIDCFNIILISFNTIISIKYNNNANNMIQYLHPNRIYFPDEI